MNAVTLDRPQGNEEKSRLLVHIKDSRDKMLSVTSYSPEQLQDAFKRLFEFDNNGYISFWTVSSNESPGELICVPKDQIVFWVISSAHQQRGLIEVPRPAVPRNISVNPNGR